MHQWTVYPILLFKLIGKIRQDHCRRNIQLWWEHLCCEAYFKNHSGERQFFQACKHVITYLVTDRFNHAMQVEVIITKLHVTTSIGPIIGGSIGGFLLLFIIIIVLIKVKQSLPLCLHIWCYKEDQVKCIAFWDTVFLAGTCNCVLHILVNIAGHLSILCLQSAFCAYYIPKK